MREPLTDRMTHLVALREKWIAELETFRAHPERYAAQVEALEDLSIVIDRLAYERLRIPPLAAISNARQ